jgi:uncharacterized protein (DUF2267 family)
MDELVKAIVERTGLPENQARQAAETAVTFLKERLPAPLAQQVDNALSSEGLAGGAVKVIKGLGGMLGGKK